MPPIRISTREIGAVCGLRKRAASNRKSNTNISATTATALSTAPAIRPKA